MYEATGALVQYIYIYIYIYISNTDLNTLQTGDADLRF